MALSISTSERSPGQVQIVLLHAAGARTPVQLNYSSYLVVKGSELGSIAIQVVDNTL